MPTPKVSRGVRILGPRKKESLREEDAKLKHDTSEIEQWWKDSRWNYTTRTFTGESVEGDLFDRIQ